MNYPGQKQGDIEAACNPPKPSLETINRNVRAKFGAKYLQAMVPFIPKNDIRYYLNGLRVERAADKGRGVYLVATNGHQMAVVYDADGAIVGDDGRGVILRIPAEMVSASRKRAMRSHSLMVIVSGSRVSLNNDFNLEHTDTEVYVMPGRPYIDGKYPDWRRVLPEFDKLKRGIAADVNIRYLDSFNRVSIAMGGDRYGSPAAFWQEEPHKAVLVQLVNVPEFLGIIMPMHGASDDATKAMLKPILRSKTRPEPKPEALRDKLNDEYSSGLDSPPGD